MNVASPRRKRRETLELFPQRGEKAKNGTTDSSGIICAQQLRSNHRTNQQKRGRAGQSDGSRFEPVSVLAALTVSSRSLGSLICQTKRILFSVVVQSSQRLNEKLQTTHVSVRRMATMEYSAAVKMNKQQRHAGMLMTLRRFIFFKIYIFLY